jgi:hypothetical protein
VMYLRGIRRTTLVGAVLVAVTDVVLLAVALSTYFGGAASTATSPPHRGGLSPAATLPHQRAATDATSATPSSVPQSTYRPLRVVPPQTAVQQTIDQSLNQNSLQGARSVPERTAFPAPAISSPFPAIGAADSSSASLYAMAFTQELLDVHFVTSTRKQLLARADYNNAPYSLGDVPASLATRLLDTSLTTGSSPVPPATMWTKFAKSRTSWNVSGLVVSVNPTWTQALSAGWEPVDPYMGIYDVSGILNVVSPGQVAVVKSISFALTLGGASLHPGYGAVALDDWTVK